MGHPRKSYNEPCCYHITHRCQERRFLLKFKKDRRRYLRRLLEASRKYDVTVLDYIVTCNHVHILFHSASASAVSGAMRYIQGNSARDYNQRKEREGSFWRGRYHPTMIQDGAHLSRCIFYIDMNMVRAGKCAHPSEWAESGYHELAGLRRRNLIISRDKLLECLGHRGEKEEFGSWYKSTLGQYVEMNYHSREPVWSESLAIGSREWLVNLGKGVHGVEIEKADAASLRIGEEPSLYRLTGSSRARQAFWKKHQG